MTDAHMELLAWLVEHEGASLVPAAKALRLPLVEVERLASDLSDAGMVQRTPFH